MPTTILHPRGRSARKESMTSNSQPDPSVVGGVPKPPLAFLPDPVKVFTTRSKRFAFLAQTSRLGPYLEFLGELSALQARLAAQMPDVTPPDPDRMRMARAGGLPPIGRATLVHDAGLIATLARLTGEAATLSMPEPARLALGAVSLASEEDRSWLLSNVLSDRVPEESAAPHLFVAAAVQVHLARLAAALEAGVLQPIRVGVCPSCAGRPATSSVMGMQGIENVRYATCATCATRWNEVRIKCLCCGSTKGISYRSAETAEATVKAEVCTECHHWVKIFYQVKNPSLDPIADDVGSLGLDLLMKETDIRRGGFNPFLVGY
jgi:FdhE protein